MSSQQHRFEVTGSTLLVDAPIIALRRDEVRMPGGDIAQREIVEHFGAVAVVAIRQRPATEADASASVPQVALVRQYRQCVQRRLWELPAGLLDYAQEPELQCAQRELQEEAGLGAHKWSVLVDLITSPGFCDEAVRVFLAEDLFALPQPEAEHEEADMELVWWDLDEAIAMIHRGEIVNAICMSGLFSAQSVLSGRAERVSVDRPFGLRPTALPGRRQAQGYNGDMKRR